MPLLLTAGLIRWLRRNAAAIKWKALGIKIGNRCHIGPSVRSADPRNVELGNRVVIGAGVQLASETGEGRLVVADGVEIGRRSIIDHAGDLTIEANVLISESAIIYTHDHGYDPRSRPSSSPLLLKEGCWIGARAIVLPCVNYIGSNSIVGAGCIVSQDVPDEHIFVGGKGRLIPRKDINLNRNTNPIVGR